MIERVRRFWDARAVEDAAFFVDNRRRYRDPDLASFWEEGEDTVDELLERLSVNVEADDEVVEIGCGIGRLTRALAGRAARVRALDVSGEMLRRAAELNAHLGNVEWIEGDGHSLAGISDASADAVLSHVVFQHLPEPELTYGYVRETGRVLRPGGWAGLGVSNDPRVHRRPRWWSLRLRGPRGMDDPAWLGSAVDLDALGAAAREGGMDVEHVVGEGTQFCLVRLRRSR